MSDTRSKIETTETDLLMTRMFDAPRELVFAAYSSCEHLKNWWGPRSWPMAECTLDFRVGGVWHYCLRGPNPGDESWGRAVYTEIVEPERILYTDSFSDAEGNVAEGMPTTDASVEFAELDGKTVMTMRARYPKAEDLKAVIDMGAVEGIEETFDRLAEFVAREAAAKG